jgi:aminoglycoside phosphotransferase (APT) family kinase protein
VLPPREYSRRLGTVTHEQLQAALDRFDLGTLVAAEAAPGGLFGQNIMLTTSDGGYVLRGNPHPGQMDRERHAAEIIKQRTAVPVPWPYLIENDASLFGWPYAMMPRLAGVQLADGDVRKGLTTDDRAGIVVAVAECLAALHDAAFDFIGVYDESARTFTPAVNPYADWFADWTRFWLAACRAASTATTDDDVAWVESVIGGARAALAEPFAPRLVHTDWKEGNAVAQEADGRWRITGVFDLAETYLGDGEYDLARAYCEYALGRPHLARLYVETYLTLRPPRPGFEARFRHYVLHDRLIIWEYGQRNGVWFRPNQTLRSWADPFLAAPAGTR